MIFDLKKDCYQKKRGSYSRLLNLFCRVCKKQFAVYQKDGAGNLRRLYFDRILYPKKIVHLEKKLWSSVPPLSCHSCREALGTPYLYKKEHRKAFKLYQDAVIKKIRKNKS